MKTRRTAKGFTLVELIVVIAIIGVLAAILVPSMLGYVKKSKVSSMNANAKSLFDAANTACVELDSEGSPMSTSSEDVHGVTASGTDFKGKVYNYFNGVKDLEVAMCNIENGVCVATVCADKNYAGSFPNPTTVDDYETCAKAGAFVAYK